MLKINCKLELCFELAVWDDFNGNSPRNAMQTCLGWIRVLVKRGFVYYLKIAENLNSSWIKSLLWTITEETAQKPLSSSNNEGQKSTG